MTDLADNKPERVYFTDETMDRRRKALWYRLVRVHVVMLVFAFLALAIVDPRLWEFFALGVGVLSVYASFTLLITRTRLLIPNVGCNDCQAVGFPADIRKAEGRCQRCGSERLWVRGKRKFKRPDSWKPSHEDEPPPGMSNAIPATGQEILDGAVTVYDGFGGRTGGD